MTSDYRTFRKLLRERQTTLTELAAAARVSRCHLTAVLQGRPGRGLLTRKHVVPHLTEAELKALGWWHGAGGGEQEGRNGRGEACPEVPGNVQLQER